MVPRRAIRHFLHWGLYSEPGGVGTAGLSEWIMNDARIPAARYERLASFFNPVHFDADAWVRQFKAAGARYIVITSKHHDGFAMFKSTVSTYNVVDATPFKRDPLAELAAACQRQGIKLFFYYSQLDWHHPGENLKTLEEIGNCCVPMGKASMARARGR
jgi:alpha-L-fucosidase